MADYKKMYCLLCRVIDDVIGPLEKLPMTEKYAERLKQALEDAEEIYIETSLYAAERERAEIISFESVKKNDQNSR